jgi:polypeptide N-acetylgalactosaminyltransferase
MIKGRLWRFLTFFFALYLIFLFIFFRSFNSDTDETTTTSPLPHARAIIDVEQEQNNVQHHVAAREIENDNDKLNKNIQSDLAPVMIKDELGNYEPKNPAKPSGPGEDGEGVQLKGEDVKLGQESVAEYGFNEVASEKISLDRRPRDTRYREMKENLKKNCFFFRPEECKHWNYPSVDKLPTASVVLVFYDEGWSTLVRTFHSVINTSPKELLKDIILVDDYSDQEHITVRLPQYIKKWNGLVKYVRAKQR